jgi:uncharacterized protein (DUF952 family)
MTKIFHITSIAEWQKAKDVGEYVAPSLEKQGFIHCSQPTQILGVANLKYRGRKDMILLEVDTSKLQSPLKHEPYKTEVYPHVYGPIQVSAVTSVLAFPSEEDGQFLLPAEVPLNLYQHCFI